MWQVVGGRREVVLIIMKLPIPLRRRISCFRALQRVRYRDAVSEEFAASRVWMDVVIY
jgi:hypothetical protein